MLYGGEGALKCVDEGLAEVAEGRIRIHGPKDFGRQCSVRRGLWRRLWRAADDLRILAADHGCLRVCEVGVGG